ncbi:DUF2797 domain-containing protein [Brevibacillus brevis]|nr:DUF2797 domain-containing protein [Brevibacillus brevis]
MSTVPCAGCGRQFEYLVDLGFCEECFKEQLNKEE